MKFDRLSTHMTSLARRRVLLASGAVSAAIATVMFATADRFSLAKIALQCGQPAPDVRWITSVEGVRDFLTSCGEGGRAAYRDLQLLDLVYPAAIGVFLASALAFLWPRLLGRRHPSIAAIAIVPLLAAAADYLENLGAWVVLAGHPDNPSWAANLFAIASPAKQALNWASILLVVVGLIGVSASRLRPRTAADDDRLVPGAPFSEAAIARGQ